MQRNRLPRRLGAQALAAALLLAALAGCTAAPPGGGSAGTAAPASAPASPPPATAESAALPTVSPSPTPEPTRDPAGAAVFRYAQQADAAQRARQYWDADMTTGFGAYRYALAETVAASVLNYEECSDDDALRAMLSYQQEGPTTLDRIYDGEGMLVQVHFYVEYEPEMIYLGPQYGDGANYVYLFVPLDADLPCEVESGWRSAQIGERIPRQDPAVMVEGLTMHQSRMLRHQCRAMAAAGLRDFTGPQDWTEEERYRYLYFRGQDYGYGEKEWQERKRAADCGNRLLTIDFTAEDDWYSNQRFFAWDWPGFTPEQLETYRAGLESGAVPGYAGDDTAWQFAWDGDTLTATMLDAGGRAVQAYTFVLYDGFASWDGRTVCTGGRALA